jgi:hypothetical protein
VVYLEGTPVGAERVRERLDVGRRRARAFVDPPRSEHLGVTPVGGLVAGDADDTRRAEAVVALRPHVVVIGDRGEVETPCGGDEELALHGVAERVGLLESGVPVLGASVGVVRVRRVHVEVAGGPGAVRGRARCSPRKRGEQRYERCRRGAGREEVASHAGYSVPSRLMVFSSVASPMQWSIE